MGNHYLAVGLLAVGVGIASAAACGTDVSFSQSGTLCAAESGGSSATGGHGGGPTGGSTAGGGHGGQGLTIDCWAPGQCPPISYNECVERTCKDSVCGYDNLPVGTPCEECGDQCNGKGSCVPSYPVCDGADCGWAKSFGNSGNQWGLDIAVDDLGAVFVSGMYKGALQFGEAQLTSVTPENSWEPYDGFVLKLAPNGNPLWAIDFGDSGSDSAEAITVDSSGDVLVAGFFKGTVDLGGTPLLSVDEEDVLVAKLGSDGQHLWSHRFGGPGHQFAHDIAVDPAGNAIVIGHFDGTLAFGSEQLVSAGRQDIFIAKLDPTGTVQWQRQFGSTDHDVGWRVAVDGIGGIYAAGSFETVVDFGGGDLQSAGKHDVFLLKLDADGEHVYSQRIGGQAAEYVGDVAIDPAGAAFITGTTMGSSDIGGSPC